MDSSANYKLITIQLPTIWGYDSEQDKYFTDYLDEYSIAHTILETESEFPVIEYTGGPVSLSNMLQEKFGYNLSEIRQEFPELGNEVFE